MQPDRLAGALTLLTCTGWPGCPSIGLVHAGRRAHPCLLVSFLAMLPPLSQSQRPGGANRASAQNEPQSIS